MINDYLYIYRYELVSERITINIRRVDITTLLISLGAKIRIGSDQKFEFY